MSRGSCRVTRGFTIVEIIVAITVSVAVGIGANLVLRQTLQAQRLSADFGEVVSSANAAMATIRSLLERVDVNGWGDVYEFTGPARWRKHGLHFMADLDRDGYMEWVWLWMDYRALGKPNYGPLKMTAFRRYPGRSWRRNRADFRSAFYSDVNSDPRRYIVLANRLAPPPPNKGARGEPESLEFDRQGGNVVQVTMRFAVDRDQSGRVPVAIVGEAFVVLSARLHLGNTNVDLPGVLSPAANIILIPIDAVVLGSTAPFLDVSSGYRRGLSAMLTPR